MSRQVVKPAIKVARALAAPQRAAWPGVVDTRACSQCTPNLSVRCVWRSMSPGSRVASPRSIRRVPGGRARREPTSAMRSPSMRTMAGERGAPPRPSIKRAALTTTVAAGASAATLAATCAAASAARSSPAARMASGLLVRGRVARRLLSGQEPIEACHDVLQIGGVTAPGRSGQLGRHPAVVADVGEGLADLDPVDVAFAEVLPRELSARPVELEVLQVDLRDARSERAHPVLRVPIEDDVPHVEVGLDPGRGHLVHVTRELDGAQEELVPDLLDRDDHLEVGGEGQQPLADDLLDHVQASLYEV